MYYRGLLYGAPVLRQKEKRKVVLGIFKKALQAEWAVKVFHSADL